MVGRGRLFALIQRFQEDHLFSRTRQAFFSFASFLSFFSSSFSIFFFFGTRLLTLRNLRYVATRLQFSVCWVYKLQTMVGKAVALERE